MMRRRLWLFGIPGVLVGTPAGIGIAYGIVHLAR